MNPSFIIRIERDALIVSFPAPARTLSWAVVNGGFCHADHIINHHVSGSDRLFCARPQRWLEEAASRLELQGTVVAMATAVAMNSVIHTPLSAGNVGVNCFATVGCGNALSVGDPASVTLEEPVPSRLHTINMTLTVQPGLTDEAMVEAIQIATEGRVRALYEAGIQSSLSTLAASKHRTRTAQRRRANSMTDERRSAAAIFTTSERDMVFDEARDSSAAGK